MRRIVFLILGGPLVFLASCSSSEPSAGQCFRLSTGLDLPTGVKCLNSEVITVAFVGDTYYLKLKSDHDLSSFLKKNFGTASWAVVKKDLVPPADWAKDLPFWNEGELRKKEYYSKDYRDENGGLFRSALSYDNESGILYFVGSQCRD
jgi:hypothetical protein